MVTKVHTTISALQLCGRYNDITADWRIKGKAHQIYEIYYVLIIFFSYQINSHKTILFSDSESKNEFTQHQQ